MAKTIFGSVSAFESTNQFNVFEKLDSTTLTFEKNVDENEGAYILAES